MYRGFIEPLEKKNCDKKYVLVPTPLGSIYTPLHEPLQHLPPHTPLNINYYKQQNKLRHLHAVTVRHDSPKCGPEEGPGGGGTRGVEPYPVVR